MRLAIFFGDDFGPIAGSMQGVRFGMDLEHVPLRLARMGGSALLLKLETRSLAVLVDNRPQLSIGSIGQRFKIGQILGAACC